MKERNGSLGYYTAIEETKKSRYNRDYFGSVRFLKELFVARAPAGQESSLPSE